MKTIIFLVRHGQTKSNVFGFYMGRSEEDLDETGYSQVRRLAPRLASQPLTAIYTSPLKRAYATAEIIAEPHALKLTALDGINEIDLGDWQGRHMDEVRQKWPDIWNQSRIDPSGIAMPHGESFKQVATRAVHTFDSLVASHNGDFMIVTHDIIIRIIVAHVLGVPTSIYRRLEINNASLSVIKVIDSKRVLLALNDTSHLGGWNGTVI